MPGEWLYLVLCFTVLCAGIAFLHSHGLNLAQSSPGFRRDWIAIVIFTVLEQINKLVFIIWEQPLPISSKVSETSTPQISWLQSAWREGPSHLHLQLKNHFFLSLFLHILERLKLSLHGPGLTWLFSFQAALLVAILILQWGAPPAQKLHAVRLCLRARFCLIARADLNSPPVSSVIWL